MSVGQCAAGLGGAARLCQRSSFRPGSLGLLPCIPLDKVTDLLQRAALHLQQTSQELAALVTLRKVAHLRAQALLDFSDLVCRIAQGEAFLRGSCINLALQSREQLSHALVGSEETLAQKVKRHEFQLVVRWDRFTHRSCPDRGQVRATGDMPCK